MTSEEVGGHEKIESDDKVVISMEQMLMALPDPNNLKCFLYQVPRLRRQMNDTIYTPQIISIGPFHHGQQQYKAAEQYKLHALKRYLSCINMRFGEAMNIAEKWEERARNCYAHPIDHMNSEKFVKMMLLDGCFILEFMNTTISSRYRVEFMKPTKSSRYGDENDEDAWIDYSLMNGTMVYLTRDLVMFENQLPFFVLEELFYLSLFQQNINKPPPIHFMTYMSLLFEATTTGFDFPTSNVIESTREVRHWLDLLRLHYIPSLEIQQYKKFKETQDNGHYTTTPTITELCEAGVKLQRVQDAQSLMDFSFKNGVLKIPNFVIHNDFEVQIRNLIVSEMFNSNIAEEYYVFHYLALLDDLINTEKDVHILVKEKILSYTIGGSDEQVSNLINKLRIDAPTFPTKYYYYNLSKDLSDYCKKRWHRSMASLRRDYFNTPWASISFVAATILLILTFLQTLFSAPSIFH